MTVLTEGKLQLTISNAVAARKFDDASHKLSHCMKAVDFVVELSDHYLFIEFKDPQDPQAATEDSDKWIKKLQSGQLDENLKYKYRDSFLYEWADGRADKPVYYLILIALDTLAEPFLLHMKKEMERKLPLQRPGPRQWPHPIVGGCGVFNIASWNECFPRYPVERLTP